MPRAMTARSPSSSRVGLIDYRLTLTALEGADAAAALEDWT